ncbi:HAMP domain-containing histidine kinase [Bacillus sp. FJAT-49732]|uniref:histidine kinase n=1 Tax=Lederbergia citrisecunda TaxID=2833583 RepID=A0A942YMV7_9BACI|nr:HAMP domain-containing sensor histidine kinase [Lederbergia citrisecunda]MBS4201095.1 HAMP domain-containing histidine kinase [Lederbergia citrisecunda]
MKLRNKINLYTSVLFVILLVIMNILGYFVFSHLIINSELKRVRIETEMTVAGLNESLQTIPAEDLLRAYVPVDGMIRIIFPQKPSLPTVTSSASEQDLGKLDKVFYKGEKSAKLTFNNKTYAFVSVPIIWMDGDVANLQVTSSIQPSVDNLNILKVVLLFVTLIATISVTISSRILSQLITNPITSMIEIMTEIRRSGQFKRVDLNRKSKDELVEMGETFNHMIDLLETNFEKQEQFVSNASHELKTPLTIIESYASLLRRRGQQESDIFIESVEAIQSESVRMRELTEQLLFMAKHNEHWNIKKSRVNLFDIVLQSIKSFQNAYQREIELNRVENLWIYTDEQKLKQLLFIILDNARKYSEDLISVVLGKENNQLYIQIIDRGIGIPETDQNKIFDRFYRVDKARNRKQGGTGLGLPIAKEIADAIGAKINLSSVEKIGTTVTIYLPIDEKSD